MNRTWRIHISGLVQGVGFRPFVYKLANSMKLHGIVKNTSDGVEIDFNASANEAELFHKTILNKSPSLSVITSSKLTERPTYYFDTFDIQESKYRQQSSGLMIAPDYGVCGSCLSDISESENKRFHYSFTTCTQCGPRFSVLNKLPYDRENTTMGDFTMCNSCREEYEDIGDRRHHSQTNSCHDCGVQQTLYSRDGSELAHDTERILEIVPEIWQQGGIVAIKGIGGFLLTCDASNATTIAKLRKSKNRPTKPFAVMMSPSHLNSFELGNDEISALTNQIAPITIIRKPKKTILAEGIAPNLNKLGIIMPYTPLFALLLDRFKKPIVATSANISQSPIVHTDEDALGQLTGLADYILGNNRKISFPLDDSVLQFTPVYKKKIILRRSRGLAPTMLIKNIEMPDQPTLALGAMQKSTFTITNTQSIYTSQYFGNLENYESQERFRIQLHRLKDILNVSPKAVIVDLHPSYSSTQIGRELSNQWNVPLKSVQHHEAHFAAVLGENALVHSVDPILGVIWDGTGYGSDKQIWGGEFFVYKDYTFERNTHFEYFNSIAGDKISKEPRIAALAMCYNIAEALPLLRPKFTKTEWKIYQKILGQEPVVRSSSIGRLFDAVASLLRLVDQQSYEGEAAMQLENEGNKYVEQNGLDFLRTYEINFLDESSIPSKQILKNIVIDIQQGVSNSEIAAVFHFTLIKIIEEVAMKRGISKIAFSGGVFQNSLLIDLIIHHLSPNLDLYFHNELSPNDESISFGQIIHHQISTNKALANSKKRQLCV